PQWRAVTRLWYIHRGVAAIAQALVWLAVIPVILSRWVDSNSVAVIVAVVSAVVLIYIRGLDQTVHNVLHPSFYVGDLVHLLIPGGASRPSGVRSSGDRVAFQRASCAHAPLRVRA